MTRNEKVRVVWKDAHSVSNDWISDSEIKNEPCLVESLGWLLKDKVDDHLVLAQSWNISAEEPEYDGVLAIPVGMVITIESLTATTRELFN